MKKILLIISILFSATIYSQNCNCVGSTALRKITGTANPNGTIAGVTGEIYQRKTSQTTGALYVKESGNGTNTGWSKVLTGTMPSSGWSLTGNSGTTAGTNFIGTTDGQPIVFKTGSSHSSNQFSGIIDGEYLNTSIGFNSNNPIGDSTLNSQNTAIGGFCLTNVTYGINNNGLGVASLGSNTYGNRNIGVGVSALGGNTIGNSNIGIGEIAMQYNTTGSDNIAVGDSSMQVNLSGIHNTCVGSNSDVADTATKGATAIGAQSVAADSSFAGGLDAIAPAKTVIFSPHTQVMTFPSADSVTLITITPANGSTSFCSDCSGSAITGRFWDYIGGAWRRRPISLLIP